MDDQPRVLAAHVWHHRTRQDNGAPHGNLPGTVQQRGWQLPEVARLHVRRRRQLVSRTGEGAADADVHPSVLTYYVVHYFEDRSLIRYVQLKGLGMATGVLDPRHRRKYGARPVFALLCCRPATDCYESAALRQHPGNATADAAAAPYYDGYSSLKLHA